MPFLIALLLIIAATPAAAETIQVRAGGDLQGALNAARPGDEVVLDAGATFVGNFEFPPKPAGPAITIRSSATLPNRRIGPADAALLPIVRSANSMSALMIEGTANWRIDGVQFGVNLSGMGNVIQIHNSTNITLDRILIVAPPTGQKRGVAGNGRQITLTRSHISGIWAAGQDSQAFCAWDGGGPYTITDNYLEAASENVMFGGANSASPENVPADILVERNHFTKPLEWKGTPKVVKNLFELKSAKRVVVRHNLFENNWSDGQSGYAIVFTVRNDEGGSPWSVVEDVLFERNIVRNTENGFNILGYDSYQPSGQTTRVKIRHNLVIASKNFMQVGSEVGVLEMDHNTVDQAGTFGVMYGGDVWVAGAAKPRAAAHAIASFTVTNMLAYHGEYGLYGDGATSSGTNALEHQTGTYRWTNNVMAGPSHETYPPITWKPSLEEHRRQFNADYTLISGSTYRSAGTDGLDLGVVWSQGAPGVPGMKTPPAPSGLRVVGKQP